MLKERLDHIEKEKNKLVAENKKLLKQLEVERDLDDLLPKTRADLLQKIKNLEMENADLKLACLTVDA